MFSREWRSAVDAELIVSDGGSTDRTLAIAEQHADIVVRHDDSQRRQTIAEGRNQGAKAASGSVLVFINGDTVPRDLQMDRTARNALHHPRIRWLVQANAHNSNPVEDN